MKKPIILVLILFAVYSLGVVFYYNQDQIKSEVTDFVSKIENLRQPSEKTSEPLVVEAKNFGTLKDTAGNEVSDSVQVNVTTSGNDVSKVFNTPVNSHSSRQKPLATMLQDPLIAQVITIAFCLFALIQWLTFFASFSPENALKNMLVPVMSTFLALQWEKVISWFMIGL